MKIKHDLVYDDSSPAISDLVTPNHMHLWQAFLDFFTCSRPACFMSLTSN